LAAARRWLAGACSHLPGAARVDSSSRTRSPTRWPARNDVGTSAAAQTNRLFVAFDREQMRRAVFAIANRRHRIELDRAARAVAAPNLADLGAAAPALALAAPKAIFSRCTGMTVASPPAGLLR